MTVNDQELMLQAKRELEDLGYGERLRLLKRGAKALAFKEESVLDRVSMEIHLHRRRLNLGMKLGNGLAVLDADGPTGEQFLARHQLSSPMVCITKRGKHHYFRHDSEGATNKIKLVVGGVRIELDVMVNGSMVIPNSVVNGHQYAWEGKPVPFEELPLLDLAIFTEPLLKPKFDGFSKTPKRDGTHRRYADSALRNEVQKVAKAKEGTRNATLNRAAFSLGGLVAVGLLSRETVEAVLFEAALAAGLGETEIAATLKSGLTAGLKRPRRGSPSEVRMGKG